MLLPKRIKNQFVDIRSIEPYIPRHRGGPIHITTKEILGGMKNELKNSELKEKNKEKSIGTR